MLPLCITTIEAHVLKHAESDRPVSFDEHTQKMHPTDHLRQTKQESTKQNYELL